MLKYGKKSKAVLAELHSDLQTVLQEYAALATDDLDISLIDGWRSGSEQDAALARGASTLPAGKSKHNVYPARAFDFRVYPDPDWPNPRKESIEYAKRVGFMLAIAARHGINLRCGIDWLDPYDPYHVELRD